MQVTETLSDGLKREFKVVIPADDLKAKIDARLEEVRKQAQLPGFRPGKVPLAVVKQRYTGAVTGEVLEQAVNEASTKTMSDRGLRPAMQPKVDLKSYGDGKDLEYTLAVEVLPDVKPIEFASLELERLKIVPTDEEVQKAVERMAEQRRKSEPVTEARPAAKGDVVVIDFVGTMDGKPFEGGAATDFELELGSGSLIPGFEDQVTGKSVGDDVTVDVTFPADYQPAKFAAKAASFAVKLKALKRKLPAVIDDALAKDLGLDTLDELKRTIRDQLARDYQRVSRGRLKRQLLDTLSKSHDFAVPEGMVEGEFKGIMDQIKAERERGTDDASIKDKTDEQLTADFRPIAERRIRLGLLLAEVGRANNLDVTQDEINRAMIEEARRYPGQERQVMDFLRNNQDAQARMRAPLFEDKVVDFVLEMAKVKEREVSPAEFAKAEEADDKADQA